MHGAYSVKLLTTDEHYQTCTELKQKQNIDSKKVTSKSNILRLRKGKVSYSVCIKICDI